MGQSVGGLIVAGIALALFMPTVFVDTTGVAFSYPLARLLGCRVVAYTHYPTMSTDMLRRVRDRTAMSRTKLHGRRLDEQTSK